jgi:hypothetical protein
MLEIYLCMLLQRCKVCGIITIIFKNVENFLLKYLHRYKKLYYICGMNTVFEQGKVCATYIYYF